MPTLATCERSLSTCHGLQASTNRVCRKGWPPFVDNRNGKVCVCLSAHGYLGRLTPNAEGLQLDNCDITCRSTMNKVYRHEVSPRPVTYRSSTQALSKKRMVGLRFSSGKKRSRVARILVPFFLIPRGARYQKRSHTPTHPSASRSCSSSREWPVASSCRSAKRASSAQRKNCVKLSIAVSALVVNKLTNNSAGNYRMWQALDSTLRRQASVHRVGASVVVEWCRARRTRT